MTRHACLRTGAAMLAFAVSCGRADVPLGDSAHGMTCHYYAAVARLQWNRPGGDWVDARGQQWGERAYAVAAATPARLASFDITALASSWNTGNTLPAVMLRSTGGRGIVNFVSREHADEGARPRLIIEWADGSVSKFEPSADTYFACPTHKSLGGGPIFRVGGGYAAALVFPFEPRPGRSIRQATLRLNIDKQHAGGTPVGVFRLEPPSIQSAPPQTGLAAAYASDASIRSHPDVIFAERFENDAWGADWLFDGGPRGQVMKADPERRFESLDGSALKVTIEQGQRLGLNAHLRFAQILPAEPEEVYFRYYLRLGDDWDPVVSGGKLPGLSGTYGKAGWGGRASDGRNGWSARGAFFQHFPGEPVFASWRGIGSYVYQMDAADSYGDAYGWNMGPTGLLRKNRWYCIEQHVKLNRPGQSDGMLRAWVDGQLAHQKEGLRFRDVPDLKIESVWMNVYHGGVDKAPARHTLYIDNVVVARRYIGPMAHRP